MTAPRSRDSRPTNIGRIRTRPIFGIDVDSLKPGQAAVISDTVFGFPARSLKDIPPGDYWVQALFNRFETFHRSDGKTREAAAGYGRGTALGHEARQLLQQAGEGARRPIERHANHDLDGPGDPADPAATGHQTGQVHQVPERPLSPSSGGAPTYMGAIVLLPAGWDTHPNAHYPVLIHQGHFPKDMAERRLA